LPVPPVKTRASPVLNPDQMDQIDDIVGIIRKASYTVAMTGAGISVESGIPPFRGADGLWTRHGTPPMDGYAQFRKDPVGWWNRRTNEKIDSHVMELRDALANAKPHVGHFALVGMERIGVFLLALCRYMTDVGEWALQLSVAWLKPVRDEPLLC